MEAQEHVLGYIFEVGVAHAETTQRMTHVVEFRFKDRMKCRLAVLGRSGQRYSLRSLSGMGRFRHGHVHPRPRCSLPTTGDTCQTSLSATRKSGRVIGTSASTDPRTRARPKEISTPILAPPPV